MIKQKGFTLVELLAVIVILAIILAIAIPGISNVINSATKGALESNAKLVLNGINLKASSDSSFDPTSITEANVSSALNIDDSNIQTLTVKKINGELYITIVGKNKWSNLTVSGTKTSTRVDNTITNFSNGANKPVLASGMKAVKWDGSNWVEIINPDTDTSWYSYNTTDKQWANARTADGSMWVWIPRYIYKISTGWHTTTAGTIDVQFTKGVDDNWNKSVIGAIDIGESSNASNNKWTNHPAFTFGNTELTGIWVAKFEASTPSTNACYTTPNTTNCNVANITPTILPNAYSWRYISVGNMFATSYNMQTNSAYGWGTTGNGIDTHMIKNTEWGVVAYLSKSTYGQNANEIWINPADNYTTGCAGNEVNSSSTTGCLNTYNTTNGVKASTTGTIYGIYDMSGGSWEYTAAYINNANTSLGNGSSILGASSQYKNVYSIGSTDDAPSNYALMVNQKGDALYETSGYHVSNSSWYSDQSYTPNTSNPWFGHSSLYNTGPTGGAGIFTFSHITQNGNASSNVSFRPVLLVSSEL